PVQTRALPWAGLWGLRDARACGKHARPSLWKTEVASEVMAHFTAHLPGTFSWPELATTDQKASVAFYRGLFGWDVNDQPIGPNDMYSMFQLKGSDVAAAYT